MTPDRAAGPGLLLAILLTAAGCAEPQVVAPSWDDPWTGAVETPRAQILVDFSRTEGKWVPVRMRVEGIDRTEYDFSFKMEPSAARLISQPRPFSPSISADPAINRLPSLSSLVFKACCPPSPP